VAGKTEKKKNRVRGKWYVIQGYRQVMVNTEVWAGGGEFRGVSRGEEYNRGIDR
jgi:hypothetical protein